MSYYSHYCLYSSVTATFTIFYSYICYRSIFFTKHRLKHIYIISLKNSFYNRIIILDMNAGPICVYNAYF